ncbi:hypothetical protein [Nannocystis pusilla]|uniref:hypothetical protein n=1 Tax=Nannocystis pusilla TaxID=889268 RepID=UPI003B8072C0
MLAADQLEGTVEVLAGANSGLEVTQGDPFPVADDRVLDPFDKTHGCEWFCSTG